METKTSDKAGSTVIGIVLMITITVVVAAIVFIYVEYLMEPQEEPELYVEGTVISVVNAGLDVVYNTTAYNITLDDENTYQMLFRSEQAVVPPTNVELRFFYTLVMKNVDEDYYDVYKIKSL